MSGGGGARRTRAALVLGAAALLGCVAWLLLPGGPPPAAPPGPAAPGPSAAAPGASAAPSAAPAAGPDRAVRVRRRPAAAETAEVATPAPVPTDHPGWRTWARLRLVVAKTGSAIPFGGRDRVALLLDREGRIAVLEQVVRPAADGVLEVRRYRPPPPEGEAEGAEAEAWRKARGEIRVVGYARKEFETAAALEGDRTIPLDPIGPAVHGRVVRGPGLEDVPLTVALEPVPASGGKPPPREYAPLGGLRGADGAFAFFEVPAGAWRLEVRALPRPHGHDTARAFRVFEKGEGAIDLGEVPLERPCTIRARVVARDGTPVLDEDMVIRPADGGDADEVGGDDMDEQGWVVFRGLAPGTRYMVFASLEGVEGEVFTPPRPGDEGTLELRWDNQGTRCRLDFTVKGRPPVEWGEIREGPALDAGAWKKDGFLEHDMAPGDYLFGILAKAPGDEEPRTYWAKFTVPERILWDAVIDLKETLDE